jgi:hypothetical protein
MKRINKGSYIEASAVEPLLVRLGNLHQVWWLNSRVLTETFQVQMICLRNTGRRSGRSLYLRPLDPDRVAGQPVLGILGRRRIDDRRRSGGSRARRQRRAKTAGSHHGAAIRGSQPRRFPGARSYRLIRPSPRCFLHGFVDQCQRMRFIPYSNVSEIDAQLTRVNGRDILSTFKGLR